MTHQSQDPAGDPGRAADLRVLAGACGPQLLADVEALELLLSRPGRPCASWAEALLREFGSLPEVLGAEDAELRRVVSPAAAAQLKLAHDLARRLLAAPLRRRPVLGSHTAVIAYLRAVLTGQGREQFRVLFLDRKNRLIADEVLGQGTVDHAPVYPREVVRRALELNACALVLAHIRQAAEPAQEEHLPQLRRQPQDELFEQQGLRLGRRVRGGLEAGFIADQPRPGRAAPGLVAGQVGGDAGEEGARAAHRRGRGRGPQIGLLRQVLGRLAAEAAGDEGQQPGPVTTVQPIELVGWRPGVRRLGVRRTAPF
jgi:DNA repair protein RadC